jgi:hypothetical protein
MRYGDLWLTWLNVSVISDIYRLITFNQNNKQSYISIQHQNKKHPRCKQLNIYKEITVISISKS